MATKYYLGFIYIIENILESKLYIGQTTNPSIRFSEHLNDRSNNGIYDDIERLGYNNFKFRIIETVVYDNIDDRNNCLNELENKYINEYKDKYCLYNTIKKVNKQNKWDNTDKKEISLTEEHRNLISLSLNGRKTYDKTGSSNPMAKKVIGININTNEIIESYNCGKDLSNKLEMNYSSFKGKIRKGFLYKNIFYVYEDNYKQIV